MDRTNIRGRSFNIENITWLIPVLLLAWKLALFLYMPWANGDGPWSLSATFALLRGEWFSSPLAQDFPFTGVGMGNFNDILVMFYPLVSGDNPIPVPHAHNLFLQIAVDLGIPGLIFWLAILFISIYAAWRTYRTPDPTGLFQAFGAGLLCSQAALIAHGLTDSVVWGLVRPAPLVWALWGMALAGYRISQLTAD